MHANREKTYIKVMKMDDDGDRKYEEERRAAIKEMKKEEVQRKQKPKKRTIIRTLRSKGHFNKDEIRQFDFSRR